MDNTSCWLTGDFADVGVAVARFLADFTGPERGEALHLVLKQLRARTEPNRVLACELAWEVHREGYWSQLKHDDGSPYDSEETYFRDVLSLASWRTAYKRLAIGRMLAAIGEAERPMARAAIAAVGLAKASIIAPAIERTGQWAFWVDHAQRLPCVTLQRRVSEALESIPRGREPLQPGEYFRRAILSSLPDIEAMVLVERFFEVGRLIVGTPNPLAIFLAGCRECLADWEVHATHRAHPTTHKTNRFAHVGNDAVDEQPTLPMWANREGETLDDSA
jgi:hypothetical protein